MLHALPGIAERVLGISCTTAKSRSAIAGTHHQNGPFTSTGAEFVLNGGCSYVTGNQ